MQETDSTVPMVGYVKRLIWLPTKFLKMGIEEKLSGAFVWAFLSFAFMMLGAWFVNNAGVAKTEVANGVMFATMIVPLFLVVFPMPSTYGHSGVTQATVEFVVQHLQSRGFSRVKDIELLKKSLKPFEDRCHSRVNILKWLVGLLWAGFTYTYSKGIDHSIASLSDFMSFAFVSAFLLFGVIIAYLCVWGYDAAVDRPACSVLLSLAAMTSATFLKRHRQPRANPPLQGTPEKLRFSVPSGLRPPVFSREATIIGGYARLIIPTGTVCLRQMPNNAINSDVQKRRFALLLHAGYGERDASVEHRGVGRTAPANPSFERTPLRGFARVSLRALRALRPYAGAAQLAPR